VTVLVASASSQQGRFRGHSEAVEDAVVG
jgi:hypothetical protein